MDWQNEKCVMMIDESLPLGIIANTAAIMGTTLEQFPKSTQLFFRGQPLESPQIAWKQ